MAHNPRLLGGLAVLLSSGLVAGATGLYLTAGDEEPSKAVSPPVSAGTAPSPTPLPTLSTPSPSAEPTSSPTAAPTASPTFAPTTAPTASASPSPSQTGGGSTTYAYPKPTRTYDGLRLSATMNPGDGYTTTTFRLSVKATDGDGTIYLESIDWGDGSPATTTPNPQSCKSYPPLTSPPGPYQPQADSYDTSFTHRYSRTGTFTVTVKVASVNEDCRPNGPAKESRTAVFDGSDAVTVSAPESTPSPSPSAA